MPTLRIHPKEKQKQGDSLLLAARLELDDEEEQELWYRFPIEHSEHLSESADPFLIGCILMAMRKHADIRIHGQISPSLLSNLEEFQSAWHCWRPEKYKQIEISAEEEKESEYSRTDSKAIAAFTGGVDSCYTMYRHKMARCGRFHRNITAGLFVFGFDIPLNQPDAFERASCRARESLASIDVPLFTVSSNHKELNHEWDDTHGIGIASCLAFFAPTFSEGLIASTNSYRGLDFPWGSNPVTDRLLSSKSFSFVHDGAATIRGSKYNLVSEWDIAYNNLRVCFSAEEKDKNCGRCGKCIVTQLAIRRLGLPVPRSFDHDLRDEDILSLRNATKSDMESIESALARSVEQGFGDTSWAIALRRIISFNHKKNQLSKTHSNPLQEKFRAWRLRELERKGP